MIGSGFHKKRLVKHGGSEKYWGESSHSGRWGKEVKEGGHEGRFPDTVLSFNTTKSSPGQSKPGTRVNSMIAFFINTYTNSDDSVLDITCNDGMTGKVCYELGRNYVGIELDKKRAEQARDFLLTPRLQL